MAPPDISCITSMPSGISLGARAIGDWTKALHTYAHRAAEEQVMNNENITQRFIPDIPVKVMLDGPYGGCSIDLGDYESVVLFAGGSGMTFALGLLDDIVGRCVRKGRINGEVTRRVEVAWCIRSFGELARFRRVIGVLTPIYKATSTGFPVF